MSGQVGDSGWRQGGRRGCSAGLAPTLLSASHPASDCSLLLPARSAAPLLVRAGVRPGSVLHRAALPNAHFLQGRPWPPQQPQGLADLQKRLSAPILPRPQNKHSRCQRAKEACNEKQVSPRDLSAVAAPQLRVTAGEQGRGGGTAGLP